ncbi:MAG: tannase/feruloyl esterase family alpha/beta hydrolase [Burkholderiaceae bacterium]
MTLSTKCALLGAVSAMSVLLAACGGDDGNPAPPPTAQTDASACAALSGTAYGDNTTVTTATWVADDTTIGGAAVKAPFCRVVAAAKPTGDSNVGFEVWLPTRDTWNGKFQGVGSGSSAGSIGYAAMVQPLAARYATMATDNGHISDLTRPNGAAEQTWALGHPEKVIDFAYRAEHVSTQRAKDILASYYGKAQSKSYFVGCSQGGHHALMEASRFPEDYDGIVAGAPAWEWMNLMAAELWNSEPSLHDATAIVAPKLTVLNSAIVAACDANDGVTDGVVNDPRTCTFNPAVLQCTGADAANCLTAAQVGAAQQIYGGAKQSNGTVIFPPYTRTSETGWGLYSGATPGGSGFDFFRYTVFQDPTFNNANFNFDTDFNRAKASTIAGQLVPTVFNAGSDLAPFKARGGKLLIYHGWADQQITPLSSIDYYNRVVSLQGVGETNTFLRMFMVPGMNHCAGGPGPQFIGGSSGKPAVADADHDVVLALDRWVTQGTAPDTLIASRIANNVVTRTRPLCVYPKAAVWKGTGSTDDAANFVCQ